MTTRGFLINMMTISSILFIGFGLGVFAKAYKTNANQPLMREEYVADYLEERLVEDYTEAMKNTDCKVYNSDELTGDILEHRNGKIIIERCIGEVTNATTGDGKVLNAADEEIGEVEHLLLPATEISIMNAYREVKRFGGICYPAHIDRDSLSILSVLGEIDESCGFRTAELADLSKLEALRRQHPILDTLNIVTCSDAHYLENMRDAAHTLELDSPTAECVLAALDMVKNNSQ